MKRANKGVQPEGSGQPPAEFVEKRPPAKENPVQTTVTGTQRPVAASIGLDRVRGAAKWDKEVRFTTLRHHVTVERLHAAFRGLNPKAAKGVDDVAWAEYGESKPESEKPDLATHAKLDGEVDTQGKSATPVPESTPLRLTRGRSLVR